MIVEDVDDGLSKLAFGYRVDSDALIWCGRFLEEYKIKWRIDCFRWNRCIRGP